MRFLDKTVVITGAGSGIGRAMALRFAAEGAQLVIADWNAAAGDETAALVRQAGRPALAVPTDVGDSAAVAELFGAIDGQQWLVDVLVNNAGNSEPNLAPAVEVDDERWRSVLRVHLDGTFFCAREALRRMIPRGQGAIVNVGSVAGHLGLPGAAAYTAGKGAVHALTKGLAAEAAPHGVRVNCIAPGWVDTPILDNLPGSWRERMVTQTPLGRIGRPEEIAALAAFLASDDASFVVGQVISPNGGLYR